MKEFYKIAEEKPHLIEAAITLLGTYWREILGAIVGGVIGYEAGSLITRNEKYKPLIQKLTAGAGAGLGYYVVPAVVKSVSALFGG